MNKITIETIFKTINVELPNGSLQLYHYIALDTKRKWYLHEGMFSGMYAIHNYETRAYICGFYKSGAIESVGKINMDDLAAIKKLFEQIK